MTKLSELLEAGAEALSIDSENFPECETNSYARLYAAQSKALRAIAPALVELVAANDAWEAAEEAGEQCSLDTSLRVGQRLEDASKALSEAMEKAGVTCE